MTARRRAARQRPEKNGYRRRTLASVAILAVGLAVYLVWLSWPAPAWTVSIEADAKEVTPWETVTLVATVEPATLSKGFTWSWKSDGVEFSTSGPSVTWARGVLGARTIEVTARAANGVHHSASTTVRVRLEPYLSANGWVSPPPEDGPTDSGASSLPFSIADVWVEKSEVCQGEPSRIRVTAADTRGREKWLTPIIDGVQSWEVPFTAPPSTPGLRRVPVVLMEDRPGTTTKDYVESDVYIDVEDCVAPYPIYVESRPIPPDAEYIAFAVHLFDGPAWAKWAHRAGGRQDGPQTVPVARAAAYSWDFGDGTTATSAEPRINHRYPPEEARTGGRATSYTAKVDALAADGSKMATGYLGLAITNSRASMLWDYHVLSLAAHVASGPAPEGEDGSRSVQVTLQNLDSNETANLSGLQSTFVPCDGKEGTERPLSLSSVFSETVVPPRGSITGRLTVPQGDLDGFCSVAVQIDGNSTPSNYRVAGAFALDTGKGPGQRLTDAQMAVLGKARALLGGASVISLEDIRQLEDQGKLPKGILAPDPFARNASP